MKPEQLQSKLITLLEQADERRLSCSEVKGELEDEGTALEISQIRDGFKQLEALGRVRMAKVVPGSPVAFELVDIAGGVRPAAVAPQREPEEREDKDGADHPRGRILEALAGGALKSGEIEAKAKVGSSINYYLKGLAEEGKIERLNPANRQSAWILAEPARVSRETPLPPPATKARKPKAGAKRSVKRAAKASSAKPAAANGNLRGAFTELRTRLSIIGAIAIADVKRKVATLDQLAELVPAPIARVLSEIRKDLLQGAA